MPELWVPGASGPSVEDLVARLHRAIEAFGERHGVEQVTVEVMLHDGARFHVREIRPEPGYGFVTLCPFSDEDGQGHEAGGGRTADELIVPVGSIIRLTLGQPEAQTRFGFSLPQGS
jgi:hypothetical protein